MEVFLIGGIVGICCFCGLAEGIAMTLDKFTAEEKREEVKVYAASRVRKVS